MEVTLIRSTENPTKLITDVASICYGREEATHPDKLMRTLLKGEHHSVFEHVYFTFKIEGISRACLGQLTRHRHVSFTVRSQRYCDETDSEFVFPTIMNSEYFDKEKYILDVKTLYRAMLVDGVKREDARMVLPMATATELYMSCNLRELMHINSLRTAPGAQREINNLVKQMVEEVLKVSPELSVAF